MNDSLLSAVLIAVGVLVAIGLICALILVIAAKFFAVKVDEKEQKIRACLPGANCGACGFTGCDGYAKALAEGSAPLICAIPAELPPRLSSAKCSAFQSRRLREW